MVADTSVIPSAASALALIERIEDIAFPAVPPDADERVIEALAEECVATIPPETSHALVQGEFTRTVELVRRLPARGITCLAATSSRNVEEIIRCTGQLIRLCCYFVLVLQLRK
ncbi:hypothetical protein [Vineibacter terrae]|uniref:hypothetical protein n=1 Tax=Vineibacter terrae TaxID=2586908 RepID=UPI002E34D2D9|nr:hypothetical protein [Vineibacter terrae]HEX2888194.1 hypothetical protein [Vineibacter terrae]